LERVSYFFVSLKEYLKKRARVYYQSILISVFNSKFTTIRLVKKALEKIGYLKPTSIQRTFVPLALIDVKLRRKLLILFKFFINTSKLV